MKEMKITSKNLTAIEKVLEEANGKSKVRLACASDVEAYVKKIEQELASKGLSKKLWLGMKFRVMPGAEEVSRAYLKASHHVAPSATFFVIERKAAGWFFLGAGRDTFYKSEQICLLGWYTEEQKKAIISNAYKF